MTEERIDGHQFMQLAGRKLGDVAPMIDLVLKKQAKDLGISGSVPPQTIEQLIEKTVLGIRYFMGDEGADLVRRHMKKIFREMAPDYNRRKIGF